MNIQAARFRFSGVALGLAATSVLAAEVDLTTEGSSGTINGAQFVQHDAQATGSGVIDSFVRLQSNGTEQGFNTDARPVQFDEDNSATFNHSLLLSDVPIVNLGGTNYYQFMLDINQTGANPFLSLDQLMLFQQATGNIATFAGLTNLVYDLDAGADNFVTMDSSLNAGSGSGDIFAYVPTSSFTFGAGNPYVYLYSQFGTESPSNDGFEEWAVLTAVQVIPEPGTYALMLAGLGVVGFMARRRQQRAD